MSKAANEPIVLIYVTCPSTAVAKDIAAPLIDQRLVACANILPGMVSIYRWEGVVVNDDEAVLILKTQQRLADTVAKAVVAAHPYDLPAVLVLPVTGGHAGFLTWLADETAPLP